MKMAELTKYQKSRLCKCLFCGKEITEFQDFEFCTTKYRRYNIYTFLHSDCMVKAQEFTRQNKSLIESVDTSKWTCPYPDEQEGADDGK